MPQPRFDALQDQQIDVLIIGAGINGAGLFRDLCEQGLTCLLVDKGDFGSGTSAAPSRMIHGGLKYLETGEFGLVRQSTFERNLLLRNAPHLIHPLPTYIPLTSWTTGIWAAIRTFFGAPAKGRDRGALLIKAGLMLYDLYGARHRVMPRHSLVGRRKARQEFPSLAPDVVALAGYYDARVTAPERLVLELVQDGMAACDSALALNHTSLTGTQGDTVTVTTDTGAQLTTRPRIVINAAGPWIDRVNALLGEETQFIGGTKGAHILLDHPALLAELDGRMLYFEADDGRILLAYPYHGKVLVGTSDIPDDDPDTAACTEAEVQYFMDSLRDLLPGLDVTPDQIVFSYAGIRPLPRSDAARPGLISRDHSIPDLPATETRPFPILSLVGGKWTTFRGFAEEAADEVLHRLGSARTVSTVERPIGGGKGMPHSPDMRARWLRATAQAVGVGEDRLAELLDRYGTTARAVAMAEGASRDTARIAGTSGYSPSEIDWIARREQVGHLDDILLRRTQIAISGQLTRAGLDQIAGIAANALGWDAARRAQEVDSSLRILATRHGLDL